MKLYTKSFNTKLELVAFVNESDIKKADIVAIDQEKSGLYTLMWYAKE